MAIAIRRDRLSLDVLHDEVRTPSLRDAAVEHRGDRRVHHQGERLALGFEAGNHLAGIHTRLDHLQGDEPVDRSHLLGEPHFTHAADAERANEPVRTDAGAGGARPPSTPVVESPGPRSGDSMAILRDDVSREAALE